MFNKLKAYFTTAIKGSEFTPVKHTFFRNSVIADELFREGYCVVDFLSENEKLLLQQLYEQQHLLVNHKGGAFFSLFSSDLQYRNRINDSIHKILLPKFEQWFVNYKNVVNLFIIKTSGKCGKVAIHQDSAVIDEFKYSPINIWIPLQSITVQNGPLCIIPRSHRISVPYRGATIMPIARNIEKELYPYFIPISMEPGQALFFDSRIFHFSPPNVSKQARVVVVCRICPKDAEPLSFFKESDNDKSQIEKWSCPNDYMMNFDGYADNKRPEGGKLLGFCKAPPLLTLKEFEKKRKELGIIVQNYYTAFEEHPQNFIQEPVTNQ